MAQHGLSSVLVDFNPFAEDAPAASKFSSVLVDFDPFADEATDRLAAPPFPEAVLGPMQPEAVPPPIASDAPDAPGAVSRGFVSGLLKQNPELLAETLEGLSLLGPEQFRESFADASARLRRVAARSPEEFAPIARSIFDSGSLDEALTALGESFGQGLASTVPSLVTGTVGAVAGSRVAGRPGGIVGAIGGASLPAAGLNYGEVYKALKDEGVSAQEAAGWAALAVGPMTALDVASLGPIITRLGGVQVRKALARSIARRVAVEAAKGAGREGVTEAIQETIKDATVSLASGKPFFTVETAKGAAEAGITGAMVGGALGGGAGVRTRPIPQGERERVVQEAAVRTLTPSQDNLSPADRASPIPDDIIGSGQAIVQDALEDSEATGTANEILRRNNLPAVGARVTITLPDGEAAAGEVVDSFTETNAEMGLEEDGIKVALDGGGTFEEFVGDLAERGIVIAPEAAAVEPEAAPALPQAPIEPEVASAAPRASLEPVDFNPFEEAAPAPAQEPVQPAQESPQAQESVSGAPPRSPRGRDGHHSGPG